jgi:hypothetical protein
MTAINRRRWGAVGSAADGIFRNVTSSIGMEAIPQGLSVRFARRRAQKQQMLLHSKSTFWRFVNPRSSHR